MRQCHAVSSVLVIECKCSLCSWCNAIFQDCDFDLSHPTLLPAWQSDEHCHVIHAMPADSQQDLYHTMLQSRKPRSAACALIIPTTADCICNTLPLLPSPLVFAYSASASAYVHVSTETTSCPHIMHGAMSQTAILDWVPGHCCPRHPSAPKRVGPLDQGIASPTCQPSRLAPDLLPAASQACTSGTARGQTDAPVNIPANTT